MDQLSGRRPFRVAAKERISRWSRCAAKFELQRRTAIRGECELEGNAITEQCEVYLELELVHRHEEPNRNSEV